MTRRGRATTSTRTATTRACCARTGGARRRTRPAYLLDTFVPGAARARRRLRPGHDHRRHRRAGRARPRASASTAPTRCSRARGAAAATRASTTSSSTSGDVYALDFPDDVVRRRARAPGAAAPHRSGRRAARDAAGVRTRRRGRGARLRLRDVHVVPRRPAPHALARRCTTTSRAATTPSPTPGGTCCRGPTPPGSRTSTPTASVWCFATPRRPRLVGRHLVGPRRGVGLRRAGRRRRAWRRAAELEDIAAAWRAWSASPDAWFAILHGEIRATP